MSKKVVKPIRTVSFKSSDVNEALNRGASLLDATKEAINRRGSKMTIKEFIGKYGTQTTSLILRELAPDGREELMKELADDLQSVLETEARNG